MTSPKPLLELLTDAYHQKQLNDLITSEMLPFLAEAIQPYVDRYAAKPNTLPKPKILPVIAENFIQDGPHVQALLAAETSEGLAQWSHLNDYLLKLTQKHWPEIGLAHQEEIVSRTLERVQRYLSNFLFVARLSTWVYKIWQNECRRLMPGIKTEQARQISLDQPDETGLTLSDSLPSPGPGLLEVVERDQAIAGFWQRVTRLESELNVKILRLYLSGYNLAEIKQELGENAPSIPTIMRRKDRSIERLKEDDLIKQIALRLGIWEDHPGS